MYEGACVAGNKVEAAFALRSQSNIMGQQLSGGSSHHQSASSHSKSSASNSSSATTKVYPRHSINASAVSEYRDIQRMRASIRTKDPSVRIAGSDRPVTISEMNAYNVEKSSEAAVKKMHHNKEFFTVGEGYHKTEHCYYKTPDGGFHKLPPDSFHKMSEICYTKLSDGSFRRLDAINVSTLPANAKPVQADDPASGSHHKVRNQMIRFLKRSKSHTPATIKELQKSKEKERERLQAAAALERQHNGGNRKVVVTMMESGGLPVVATSKPTPRRVETMRETKTTAGGKDQHGRSKSTSKVCGLLGCNIDNEIFNLRNSSIFQMSAGLI